MKSVLITFVMFFVLFGLLKLNILSVLNGSWFPILSLVIFLIVIAIAVAMFGLPTKNDFLRALKLKGKDTDNEKDK